MAEALEAAVDLAGDLAVGVVEAVEHVLPALAGLGDVQVLHGHQLGDREAVVHLEHRDLVARVLDAGLFIGLLRGDAGGVEVAAVPRIVARLRAVRDRELQCLDRHDVVLAHRLGDLGRRHDGRGRTVRHAAAVEQAERRGDHRGFQDGLHLDGLLEMRLGVLGAVLVALPRDMGDRLLEVVTTHAVRRHVGGGELGEVARRRAVGVPQLLQRRTAAARQAAVTGVLQLLDTQRQGEVGRARGDGVAGAAEGLGPRRAHVLDMRHRDVGKAQRGRQRNAGLADVDLVDRGREPRGVDLLDVDSGVGDAFLVGFEHQLLGARVPALAELGAAHSENSDLVLDTPWHVGLLGWGSD